MENRNKLPDKRFTFLEYDCTGLRHHLLPHKKQLLLHRKLTLQQCVTLRQCFIIPYQRFKIFLIILRNHYIHKPTTFLTSPGYQFGIGRRYHHQRQKTDVVRKTAIFFLVPFKLFLRTAFHPTINLFRSSVLRFIKALNHEKILFMTNILRINRVSGALTERQKIHRIQQIRLSHSIQSEKTIQLSRESQLYLFQILIV